MKRVFLAMVCAAMAASATADWEPPKGFTAQARARRVCVGRDIIVLDGVTNIVTRWQRAGKPDWILPPVETNAVKVLKGKKQNNALENEAAITKAIKKAKKNVGKIEAKNLAKAIAVLKLARDKSSAAMKAVYDPIIAVLEAEEADK